MHISKHAIGRVKERIDSELSDDQARLLILEMVERGTAPVAADFLRFRVDPVRWQSYVLCHDYLLIVQDDSVLTVLVPMEMSDFRLPRHKAVHSTSARIFARWNQR